MRHPGSSGRPLLRDLRDRCTRAPRAAGAGGNEGNRHRARGSHEVQEELARYDPTRGVVLSPDAYADTILYSYVVNSPAGEVFVPQDDLQYHCGSSYDSGYRWGGVPP